MNSKILKNTARRRPPNAGKGRPRGSGNRVTRDVKAAITQIAEHNVDDFETWLRQIKDPARRCEVFLKVLAYHLPQLTKVEARVNTRPRTIAELSDEELQGFLGISPDSPPEQAN